MRNYYLLSFHEYFAKIGCRQGSDSSCLVANNFKETFSDGEVNLNDIGAYSAFF